MKFQYQKLRIKYLIILINIFILNQNSISQSAQTINYQALARNKNGEVLKSAPINVRIGLVNGLSQVIYQETHEVVTSPYGVFDLSIGEGFVIKGDYKDISWGEAEYSVSVDIDISGNGNYMQLGKSRLNAVPYALHAKVADSISYGYNEKDPLYSNSHASLIDQDDVDNIKNLSGINTGDQDVSNLASIDFVNSKYDTLYNLIDQLRNSFEAKVIDTVSYIFDSIEKFHQNIPEAYICALESEIKKLKYEVNYLMNETGYSIVADAEGNIYKTVQIGDQIWMAENLRSTKYADGTAIATIDTNLSQAERENSWAIKTDTIEEKAYCWYNDDIANKEIYGALYTFGAATNSVIYSDSIIQGVCPVGWHLPSADEIEELEGYLSNNGYTYDGTVGGPMSKSAKSLADTSYWEPSGTVGAAGFEQQTNNSTGFSGRPGGLRTGKFGNFNAIGYTGYWWCSSESPYNSYSLNNGSSGLSRGSVNDKSTGLSIRCIKNR